MSRRRRVFGTLPPRAFPPVDYERQDQIRELVVRGLLRAEHKPATYAQLARDARHAAISARNREDAEYLTRYAREYLRWKRAERHADKRVTALIEEHLSVACAADDEAAKNGDGDTPRGVHLLQSSSAAFAMAGGRR